MVSSVTVVGNGQAAFQTAASLRQFGYSGSIRILGEEPGVPYQRPPLSKDYMLGKIDRTDLQFRPEKFFEAQKIELIHASVRAIDRTNHRVELASGQAVAYDHLVLAMGAHNRALPIPGAGLQGVYGLRTRADADALGVRLKHAKAVVVVGAGFIGLEFAAVANALGATVHVVELADRPMARAVSREMAGFFVAEHTRWGNNLDFRQGLASINGENGHVSEVVLTTGQVIPADIVVVGIGVIPNVALAAESGLDIDNGIRVDTYLLTSDPMISAIGDCASFPDPTTGNRLRIESVQNAADQGRAVAARVTGKAYPYSAIPWFWSDQRDLKLQMVGHSTGSDASVTLGNPQERSFTVLLFRRGHLIAVECLNRPGDFMAARKIMERQPTLLPVDAAAESFDLRAWELQTRKA